jgi:enamine deaminase RidA (YjgF/YER057c/UK114 family)
VSFQALQGTYARRTFTPGIGRHQIRQTFRNVEATLEKAGVTWAEVVALNSYHVGLRAQADAIIAIAGEFLHDPYPAWTAVGVTELFDEGAIIEISCIAVGLGAHIT